MSKYDYETRKKALELSDKIGFKQAAEQLNIAFSTLSYWRKQRKQQEEKKLSGVQKPLNVKQELAGNPYVTYTQEEEEKKDFKRGEIYYVNRTYTTGAEIAQGRPAVIVSNSGINQNLNTIEVVFLTTKPKALLVEHPTIKSSGLLATVLCEQISTVDASRIKEKIGECTPEEMEKIDNGLLSSLGLNKYSVAYASSDKVLARVSALMAERDAYKDMCNRLLQK